MTRVLHVLGALERGGIETWLLDLLEPLDHSEWQFDFCTIGPAAGRYAPLAQSRGSGVLRCPVGTTRNIQASRVLPDGSINFSGRAGIRSSTATCSGFPASFWRPPGPPASPSA